MKAAAYHQYGPPDVVRIVDVEPPVPGENEVLIRVRAAALNPLDWRLMRGDPAILRLFFGLRAPRSTRRQYSRSPSTELIPLRTPFPSITSPWRGSRPSASGPGPPIPS